MQTFAIFVATVTLLFQDVLAVKVASTTEGPSDQLSKNYVQLPKLKFEKLQSTEDSLDAKIEAAKSKLAAKKNSVTARLAAKQKELDAQLVSEQEKTELLEQENINLEKDIDRLNKTNVAKLQAINDVNASNQLLRKQLLALKNHLDEDEQPLVVSLDDGSDARVAAILQQTAGSENSGSSESSSTASDNSDNSSTASDNSENSNTASEDDSDDDKPLSFLAVSRKLRGAKEDDTEAVPSSQEASDATSDASDSDTKTADAAPEDPIATLVAQGKKELDEETQQEEDTIQRKFDEQMEICKNKTQAQEEKKSSLKSTVKNMEDYELRLQAAQKELRNSQSSLKEMVAKQATFFSKAAETLAKLQESAAPKLESTDKTLRKWLSDSQKLSKSQKLSDSQMDSTNENEKKDIVKTEIDEKSEQKGSLKMETKIDAKSEQKGSLKTEIKIDRKSVQAIVNLGFSPSDAKAALRDNEGSVEKATQALQGLVVKP